jgi:hypothetical protein
VAGIHAFMHKPLSFLFHLWFGIQAVQDRILGNFPENVLVSHTRRQETEELEVKSVFHHTENIGPTSSLG